MRKIRLANFVTVRQAQEILNGFEYKLNGIPNFDWTDSLPVTDPQEHECAQYSIQKQDFGRSCRNQFFPPFYGRSDELFGFPAHFLFRFELRFEFLCRNECISTLLQCSPYVLEFWEVVGGIMDRSERFGTDLWSLR